MNNDKYVTIKEDGVYVAGQRTTKYQNDYMAAMDSPKATKYIFNKLNKHIKKHGISMFELHIVASNTPCSDGRVGTVGEPSDTPGQNIWYRIKATNGELSEWRFYHSYEGTNISAVLCGVRACFENLADGLTFTEQDSKFKVSYREFMTKVKNLYWQARTDRLRKHGFGRIKSK